jgi:hypothetical protein
MKTSHGYITISCSAIQTTSNHVVELINTKHNLHHYFIHIRMLAATCFGRSLPSLENFWIRLSYVKIHIDMVVYHIRLFFKPPIGYKKKTN